MENEKREFLALSHIHTLRYMESLVQVFRMFVADSPD